MNERSRKGSMVLPDKTDGQKKGHLSGPVLVCEQLENFTPQRVRQNAQRVWSYQMTQCDTSGIWRGLISVVAWCLMQSLNIFLVRASHNQTWPLIGSKAHVSYTADLLLYHAFLKVMYLGSWITWIIVLSATTLHLLKKKNSLVSLLFLSNDLFSSNHISTSTCWFSLKCRLSFQSLSHSFEKNWFSPKAGRKINKINIGKPGFDCLRLGNVNWCRWADSS